jgi:hypothetical protein
VQQPAVQQLTFPKPEKVNLWPVGYYFPAPPAKSSKICVVLTLLPAWGGAAWSARDAPAMETPR